MLVDGNRFRRKRLSKFLGLAAGSSGRPVRVLDVGGTVSYWKSMQDLWSHIDFRFTIVNLDSDSSDDGVYSTRPADARSMPEFADKSFDIVHSNSVIEHVGHWNEMMEMAREVRRIGCAYFVQTPSFGFPLEPHYRTVGFHWLPESARASLLMRRRFGFRGPEPSFDSAMRNVQSINLVTRTQMKTLFPNATIESERFLGLVKSHIAVSPAK